MITSLLYIIMPFYNSATTIERSLRSLNKINSMDRGKISIIGVDDGSSDNSSEIFEKTSSEISGIQWELLKKNNGGSGSARNLALKQITKGWVLFLDADDELAIDPLPLLSKAHRSSALIFDAEYFASGRSTGRVKATTPTRGHNLKRTFSAHNPYHPLSVIFRRELMNVGFDEELRYVEDWHFWAMNLRLFENAQIHRGTALGRIHVSSSNKSADQYRGGKYRNQVISKMHKNWATSTDRIIGNNFKLQKAIGNIQMNKGRDYSCLFALPCTPFLYFKIIVYMFFYKIYLKTYPYK